MPDIIIKGGSVSLMFDETVLNKRHNDYDVYSNDHMKITRVRVQGPGGETLFDELSDHGQLVITIDYS
jgi:hypothetical protein